MNKIIVANTYAPAELTAAQELQAYLTRMTGETLPILLDSDLAPSDGEIVIGVTNRAEAEAFDNTDAFHIHSDGHTLSICGGSPRGTLYGVYHLLETLGCRFLTPDTEVVPAVQMSVLDGFLDIWETPAFCYRDLYWSPTFDEAFSAKLRNNGALAEGGYGRTLSETVGGGIRYAGPRFVHTFGQIISKEDYFDEHPEYFSEINGERNATHLYSQPCMTNPEVLQITIDTVKRWLRESPTSRLVSVSQNDSYVIGSYCTCEACQAIIDEEGSPAGPLLRFVNAVAEAIEEEFPDVYVDTLAYQYSITPPNKTKARDNVVVRYCTGGCCAHSIATCPNNAGVKQTILNWKTVCPHLYVWDYTTDFAHYLCPFPNLRTLQPNAQFFYENRVVGVFEQGNYTGGESGEFGDLRAYLLAKLLWNPYVDTNAVIEEFTDAYYGAAAPYIRDYLDFLHTIFTDDHFSVVVSPEVYQGLISEDKLDYYDMQWAKAKETVSHDAKTLIHVERSELSYRYMKKMNRSREFAVDDPVEAERLEKQFFVDCTRLGVTRLNEGANVPPVNPD